MNGKRYCLIMCFLLLLLVSFPGGNPAAGSVRTVTPPIADLAEYATVHINGMQVPTAADVSSTLVDELNTQVARAIAQLRVFRRVALRRSSGDRVTLLDDPSIPILWGDGGLRVSLTFLGLDEGNRFLRALRLSKRTVTLGVKVFDQASSTSLGSFHVTGRIRGKGTVAQKVARLIGKSYISDYRTLRKWVVDPQKVKRLFPAEAGAETYVILFLIDGCRLDTFNSLLEEGKLPNISRYFRHGLEVENAIASLPTVTLANLAGVLTGQFPNQHGIVGNAWFDHSTRQERKYRIRFRDILFGLGRLGRRKLKVNDDLQAETIFEFLEGAPTAAILSWVQKGASVHVYPLFKLGLGELFYNPRAGDRLDRLSVEAFAHVLDWAGGRGRFPSFTFIHLSNVDLAGHATGPSSAEYRRAIVGADRHIGSILRLFDRAGVQGQLTFIITSDHGVVDIARRQRIRPELSAYLKTNAFKVTAGGDQLAHVYLRRSGWTERPSLSELRHYPTRDGGTIDLIRFLLTSPAVELIATRGEDPGSFRLFSQTGTSRVEVKEAQGSYVFRYCVVKGDDPLGYATDGKTQSLMDGHFHSDGAWLQATTFSRYPDSVVQLPLLLESRRSGDLILLAALGWDFASSHKGGHGGNHAQEMKVPLLMSGPCVSQQSIATGRTIDLVPTILELLNQDPPADQQARFAGRSLLEHETLVRRDPLRPASQP